MRRAAAQGAPRRGLALGAAAAASVSARPAAASAPPRAATGRTSEAVGEVPRPLGEGSAAGTATVLAAAAAVAALGLASRRAARARARLQEAWRSRGKSHTSTVALVPPEGSAAWLECDLLRRRERDKGLWRWPTHANLLYPFVPAKHVTEDLVHELARELRTVPPFDVALASTGLFAHKRSAVVWLRPEPEPGREKAFDELQAALQRAVPHCNDATAGFKGVFTPHFTVSHYGDKAAAEEAQARLDGTLTPVNWRVDEVVVMARDGQAGRFTPTFRIELGTGRWRRDGEPFDGLPTREECEALGIEIPNGKGSGGRRNGRGRSPGDSSSSSPGPRRVVPEHAD